MRKSVTGVVLVVAAVLLVPIISYAAGLGKMTVRSALGQPLDAEIEIVSLRPGEEESFLARLASREAFAAAGIDFSPALAGARFSIERRDGKSVIRISTTQPVNDPILNVLVELQWANGRLAREYTVLVDPLEYKVAAASRTAQEQAVRTAPAQTARAPTPVVTAAPAQAALAPAAPQMQAPTSSQADMRDPAPAPVRPVAAVPASAPAPAPVAAAPVSAPVATAPASAPVAAAPASAQVATVPISAPDRAQSVAQAPAVAATPVAVPAQAQAIAATPVQAARESKPVRDLQAANSYRIRRGDTLGAIARKWKPAEVTLDQMMIALYHGNRHVFIRDNINLIRAGAVLAIPHQEQVVAIDAGSAFRQVKSQMTEFARYRRHQDGVVAAAAVRTAPGQREGTGRRVAVRKTGRSL